MKVEIAESTHTADKQADAEGKQPKSIGQAKGWIAPSDTGDAAVRSQSQLAASAPPVRGKSGGGVITRRDLIAVAENKGSADALADALAALSALMDGQTRP